MEVFNLLGDTEQDADKYANTLNAIGQETFDMVFV